MMEEHSDVPWVLRLIGAADVGILLGLALNHPRFRRRLAAINYGVGGGGYTHEAVHR